METQILSISLKDYKRELDDLRASLLQLEKGSEEYANTVNEIKSKQQSLNEVMAIGKKDTDALDGSYNALQQQMTALKKEWKATNDEARRNELGQQISALDEQLKGLDASVGQFQRNVGNYAIAGESMKSQLRATKEEMAQLLAQGVAPTDERLQQLTQTAGALEDAMGDANAMIKQAANDTNTLATVVDVAKTGTAVFGAWQGAMSAFGMESEAATEAIQRLQGIMTMLNSLQTIQTALVDKSSATYQLWNKALQAVGLSSKAAAADTQALTAAQGANTIATTAATTATNLFKKALIATGIGAIVVLLGTLIAQWDKITSAVRSVIGATDDYSQANEKLNESIEKTNHETDNEIKIMKAQGKSEKEIIAYKQQKIAAQIKEVEAKIADIQATNAQIQNGNKWYKAVTKIVNGALNAMSLALKPVLFAWDKIFGTKSLDGFNKMLKQASTSVADFAFGVNSNNKEIEELNGTLEKLKQNQVDLTYDFQAAEIADKKKTNSTKTHTNVEKDLNKALEEEIDLLKRNAAAIDNKISHANKLKKLKGQLTDLEALKEEEAYYNRQITLWNTIAEKYKTMMNKYKEGSKERIEYEKKYQEAVKQVTLNTQEAEIKATEVQVKAREDAWNDIKEITDEKLYEIRRTTDRALIDTQYKFDAFAHGVEVQIDNFPKLFQEKIKDVADETFLKYSDGQSIFDFLGGNNTEATANTLKNLSYAYKEIAKLQEAESAGRLDKNKGYAEEMLNIEIMREQMLYEYRKSARKKESDELDAFYAKRIAKMAEEGKSEQEQWKVLTEGNNAVNEIWVAQAEDDANHYIAQLERMEARDKAHKKHLEEWKKQQVGIYLDLANSIGDLMGGISDIMEENIRRKKKNGDIDDEEAEREFQRVKAMQISITWLNTLAGATGALLQGMANYPPPYGAIIGGVSAAAAMAAGVAQTMQIARSEFGEGGSGSAPTADASLADIQVSPILNQEADAGQMTALNTEQIINANGNNRVYILQQDITKSQKQVEVRQSTTKF